MVLSTRPILSKTKVVKIKIETTIGEYIATDQAVYFEDATMVQTATFIERPGTGVYRGHNYPGVIGELSGQFTGKTEMKGTGSGGCELGLAMLLQVCGLKQTAEVYQIHSDHTNDVTITIEMWESGRKKTLTGVSGTVKITGESGGRIICDFTLDGTWIAPTDETIPAFVPSTAKPFMNKGGTFTIATNAIKIATFTLDTGGVVIPRRDIAAASGIAYHMNSDLQPMFSCDPEAHIVASYDFHGVWLAGTEAAISLVLTNGIDKCTITLPKVQAREVPESDRDGILIHDFNGQCNHDSGDDSVALSFAVV